jgi:hypothetical protein
VGVERLVELVDLVAEQVVPAMLGNPPDRRHLERETRGRSQGDLEPALGLVRPVREETVEAACHAESGHGVEHRTDGDIEPS